MEVLAIRPMASARGAPLEVPLVRLDVADQDAKKRVVVHVVQVARRSPLQVRLPIAPFGMKP